MKRFETTLLNLEIVEVDRVDVVASATLRLESDYGSYPLAGIEQRSPRQETPHRSFFGSGAGGVGGLLTVTLHGGTAVTDPVSHDANGNVTALIGMTSGTGSAEYEYDPFGNLIRASGEAADLNPFRFSTKYHETETGLYYYGYRYYSPSMGRFLNRDPIEEKGGLNLYAFVGNDPVNQWDYLGLSFDVFLEDFIDPPCCKNQCTKGTKKNCKVVDLERTSATLTPGQDDKRRKGIGKLWPRLEGPAIILDEYMRFTLYNVWYTVEYQVCESKRCFEFWPRRQNRWGNSSDTIQCMAHVRQNSPHNPGEFTGFFPEDSYAVFLACKAEAESYATDLCSN